MATPDPRDPSPNVDDAGRAAEPGREPRRGRDDAPRFGSTLPGGRRPRRISVWLVGAALLLVLAAALGRLLAG